MTVTTCCSCDNKVYLACAIARLIDSDVGTGDFSLVVGILHVCGHAHVQSHVSPGMDRFIS